MSSLSEGGGVRIAGTHAMLALRHCLVVMALMACSPRVDPDQRASGTCDGIPVRVLPADLALSPRVDAEAELLAIEAKGSFVASQPDYELISEDLRRIRAAFPSLRPLKHHPTWTPDASLLIRFDTGTAAKVKAGEYHSWDCLNWAYGSTAVEGEFIDFIRTAQVKFSARFDSRALVSDYLKLVGVEYVEANAPVTDGPDVCVELNGDERHYVIDTSRDGSMSCTSSGCIESVSCSGGCVVHDYTWIRARGSGVEQMGVLHTDWTGRPGVSSEPEPGWWRERWGCVKWLHENAWKAEKGGQIPPP